MAGLKVPVAPTVSLRNEDGSINPAAAELWQKYNLECQEYEDKRNEQQDNSIWWAKALGGSGLAVALTHAGISTVRAVFSFFSAKDEDDD